jgi:hypothetical protein
VFEEEYGVLYKRQLTKARGQRLEMLERDLSGTKKMLDVLYPVIGSLEGIDLEYEMVFLSGVRIYGDAFIRALGTVLEEENYITHAENISRKRFSFERARARSVAAFGFAYFPYGRDELEQQPDACRRDLQELIALKATNREAGFLNLPVFEREVLRLAVLCLKPFGLPELSEWLQLQKEATSKIAKSLISKGLIYRVGGGEHRCHEFSISDNGRLMLLGTQNIERGSRERY